MWAAVNEVILAFKRSNASLQIKAMPSTLADKNPQLWQLWLHQLNFSRASLVAGGSFCWTASPSCWCSSRHVNKRGITCCRTSCETCKNIASLLLDFFIHLFIWPFWKQHFFIAFSMINPQYNHDVSGTMFQGTWYFWAHKDHSPRADTSAHLNSTGLSRDVKWPMHW